MKLSVLTELISRENPHVFSTGDCGELTFLYLIRKDDHHVIMTKENKEISLYTDGPDHAGPCIVLSGISNIEQTVYAWVNRYQEWRENCLKAAAGAGDVSEVLDECAKLLANPIALFDESLLLSAYSGALPASLEGTIWQEVLSSGMGRPEIYSREEADMIAQQLKSGKKSFVWNSALYRGQQHICAQVHRHDEPCGILGASGLYRDFSQGETELVEETSGFISLYFSTHTDVLNKGSVYSIERLLNGMSVTETALHRSIQPLGWAVNDTYRVYTLRRGIANEYANTSWQNRLKTLFPRSLVFIHENDLVLLENLSHGEPVSHEKMQKEFGFSAGMSPAFTKLTNLYYAYIQSLIALSYAKENEITSFDQVYQPYILESLSKLTEPKALCHPKILELYENGSAELGANLKMYLLCGRNTALCARMLYIHRNTLIYRLEKLNEILGVRLDGITSSEAFMYLMSCLIAESVSS